MIWKSLKSLKDIPHSNPAFTCLTWLFSLKIEPTFPLKTIAPSLIILAWESWFISPFKTLEPATFPILETLNIKLVNLEDSKFDIGMPVKAINIEEFKGCEDLVITKMLEPVVMCGDLLERTGTVLIGLN